MKDANSVLIEGKIINITRFILTVKTNNTEIPVSYGSVYREKCKVDSFVRINGHLENTADKHIILYADKIDFSDGDF